MANTPRTIGKTSPLRARWAPAASLSDAVVARLSAVLLWVLVVLAALGGIFAWVRSSSDSPAATTTNDDSAAAAAMWAASGFAERYVSTYLLAGAEGGHLAPFLGYSPDLPPSQQPSEISAPARAVHVAEAGDDYWSVTVAIGPPGQERYWRAAVDTHRTNPVAVGLPSAVAGPPADVDRADLAVTLGQPPADDPLTQTVTGFLGAYLCGAADLSRYVRPDVDLAPADPAVCSSVELVRWGASSDEGDDRTVVVDALLISGTGEAATPQQATYAAQLIRQDGRWEVAELLSAPPREQDED